MKIDRILVIALLLVVAFGGIWLLFFRPATPIPKESLVDSGSSAPVLSATAVVTSAAVPAATAVAVNSPEGSEAVSAIIASPDLGDKVAVEKLFELLPKLDEAAQAEAAGHIANLSSDEEAAKWSQSVIAWNLPAPVAEVLYQNLSNRSHEIEFPVLGAIADRPEHPKHQEALETLSVISDPPPAGTTWTQWLQSKLKEDAAIATP